jgi:hypothetical protein
MAVFDITYPNRKVDEQIEKLVGSPFGLWQKLRMGRVGSNRMEISALSADLSQYINADHYISKSSIELRPYGILVFLNRGMRNFAWVLPFYKVSIYKSKGYSIHAEGLFVRFRNVDKPSAKFFEDLILTKAEIADSSSPF